MSTLPVTPTQYLVANIAAARDALDTARALLGTGGATLPIVGPDYRARAIDAARNAAEHLLDIEQLPEPHEAIREAVDAADRIMATVHALEHPEPGIADPVAHAGQQLAGIEEALVALAYRVSGGPRKAG
jgi:hypothetical protein